MKCLSQSEVDFHPGDDTSRSIVKARGQDNIFRALEVQTCTAWIPRGLCVAATRQLLGAAADGRGSCWARQLMGAAAVGRVSVLKLTELEDAVKLAVCSCIQIVFSCIKTVSGIHFV